jgi:hypothetical protein
VKTCFTCDFTVSSEIDRSGAISVSNDPAHQQEDFGFAVGEHPQRCTTLRGRPGELADQPPREGGCRQGVAARDGSDGLDEILGTSALEEKSARAGLDRPKDIVVELVGRQHDREDRLPSTRR